MTPGSPEWNRLVTASKVAAILGVSPWESPRSMWHKMRGDLPPQPQTNAMSRGHFLEPAILAWWQSRHPEAFGIETQREFLLEDWAAATPDAYAMLDSAPADSCLVEAKSTNSLDDWGQPGTDEIPTYYLVQAVWQMHVSGVHRCYVPIIGPRLEFAEYVVDYDPEWGSQLEAHMRAFCQSLNSDEPPALDDTTATYDAVRKVHKDIDPDLSVELEASAAYDLVNLAAEAKALEPQVRKAKSVALEAMGRARYLTHNGLRIARRQPRGEDVTFVITAKPADLTALEENVA